jgi:hypothetical protein
MLFTVIELKTGWYIQLQETSKISELSQAINKPSWGVSILPGKVRSR